MSTNSNLYKKLLGVGLGSALAISGAFIVAPFEGKENKTYIDPVGLPTVCAGSMDKAIKLDQTFTIKECMDMFAKDWKKHQKNCNFLRS